MVEICNGWDVSAQKMIFGSRKHINLFDVLKSEKCFMKRFVSSSRR